MLKHLAADTNRARDISFDPLVLKTEGMISEAIYSRYLRQHDLWRHENGFSCLPTHKLLMPIGVEHLFYSGALTLWGVSGLKYVPNPPLIEA